MSCSRNPRSDRHGTEGRKKEERHADGKSRQHQEKQNAAEEKHHRQVGASNGTSFTDAFRRIIDNKFDVFFDSVRSECKSYQEAVALEVKQPFGFCELVSYLENVSNELHRIEVDVCEQLCHWEHHAHTLFEGLRDGSGADKVSIPEKRDLSCTGYCTSLCDTAITWSEHLIPVPHASMLITSHQTQRDGWPAAASAPGDQTRRKGNKKGHRKKEERRNKGE